MAQPVDLAQEIEHSREQLGLPKDRKFDLGILLVHGVGEQSRGDTLTEEGDYIARWLRRLVEGPKEVAGPKETEGGQLDVLEVVARQRSSDTIPAAHAVVRITAPTGASALWLVAESWWAETFRPAKPIELAGWAMTVGPWVFSTNVAGILRRMEIREDVNPYLRAALVPITWLAAAFFLVGAALVSLLVTIFAAAVLLLALVPIGFISDFARSVQRQQVNGFGDSYVLTRSPVGFGAMATQVRSDLRVLLGECSAVAVLGHSQGTAVSWYALKHEVIERRGPIVDPDRAPIRLFVTYGQAVRTLSFGLKMARESQTGKHIVLAIGGALLAGLAVWGLVAGWEALVIGLLFLLALEVELWLLRKAKPVWDASGKKIEEDWKKVIAKEPKLEWLDLWASADPAPVGALGLDGPGISSYKIRNYANPVLDHVTYWWNNTEFLPIVMGRLFAISGPKAYATDPDDPRLLASALRRHARVLVLMTARVFVWGAVVAGLIYVLLTRDFGRAVTDWVGSLDLPLVDGFFDAPPDWAVLLAGLASVLVVGVVAWLPVSLGFTWLAAADETTYFSGEQRPLWSGWWYVLGGWVAVLAGLATATLWLAGRPDLAIGYVVVSILLAALGLAVLSGGGTTFARGEETTDSARVATGKVVGHHLRVSTGVVLAIVAILVAIPVVVWRLAPDALGWTLVVESAVLSAVLAIEGAREYQLFHERFEDLNAKLSAPTTSPSRPTESH